MPINTFDTKTEYDEHIKSTTESEVSFIKDLNDVKFDGVNVHVTTPKFGDAVYIDNVLDENGQYRKHFIDGASLNPSLLPNTYTPVGVVFANENNQIYILYCQRYLSAYTTAWIYDITPKIDGQQHSIQFRQPKSSGYLEVGTFTHSCSTLEQFAQELDTWLRANQGGIAAGGDYDYDWHCEYMENYQGVMKPHVIIDNATSSRQYLGNNYIISNASDTTAYAYVNMTYCVPNVSSYRRNNGGNSYRAGIHYQRLLQQYEINTTISNPTSMISVKSDNEIVSRTQFNNNQYCADLRTAYGTFEKYIESVVLLYPTLKTGLGQEQGKSLEWTKVLADRKHNKLDGTEIDTFPCHAWSQSIGFNSKGLEVGNWYLPNCQEIYKLLKNVTYGLNGINLNNCDQLNKTLYKITNEALSLNTNLCAVGARSHTAMWMFFYMGFFAQYSINVKPYTIAITSLQV